MTTPSRRRTRVLVSVTSALLAILLASQSTLAATTWTSAVKSAPSYAYNYGAGLARTVSSTTSYLHTQYTYVNTANPGVYYRRGSASGASWATPKRLNPSTETAENGAIAAASKYVYVAYQHTNGYDNYDPSAQRQLRIRVNTNHGSSTAWLANKTWDAPNRVGHPSVAASGSYGWVAYTDADTGDIVVANNMGVNSNDAGWVATNVGTTTKEAPDPTDGKEGYPVVAASGATVMVAWVAASTGAIWAKISTDHGNTWPADPVQLTSAYAWDLSASAASGRFGVAWAQDTGIKVKLYRNGAWQPTKTVASFSATGTWRAGYGTSVALAGTGRVGVAWSACSRIDCSASSSGTKGVSVRWRESSDNLSTWKSAETIGSFTYSSSRRNNDYPSAVFVNTPKRFITYNIANYNYSAYTIVVEVGK
jgi:hypothetical protein